jgi:hypothetical protein
MTNIYSLFRSPPLPSTSSDAGNDVVAPSSINERDDYEVLQTRQSAYQALANTGILVMHSVAANEVSDTRLPPLDLFDLKF